MTAQIAAYGRLVADPQTKTTSNGNNMALARMAVSLPCNSAEDGQTTMWLSVLAFGRQADALAKHQKGDLVSVAGNMQMSQWTADDGSTRQGWQVIADSVVSARTARPGGGCRSGGSQKAGSSQPPAGNRPPAQGYAPVPDGEPFNDELPF
ncbi:TPA: single-stranded DNA-binding protein [Salmonella enterica subsp. diarizonae serovar 61:r:-]